MADQTAQQIYDDTLRFILQMKSSGWTQTLPYELQRTNAQLEALGSNLRITDKDIEYTTADEAKRQAAINEKRVQTNELLKQSGVPENELYTSQTFDFIGRLNQTPQQYAEQRKTEIAEKNAIIADWASRGYRWDEGQKAYVKEDDGGLFGSIGNVIGDFGDIYKSLGPIGTILGNAVVPGLGTALSIAAAVDEGNVEGALKSLAIGQGLSGLGVSDALTQATGSEVAGQLGTGTLGGLAAGQDLTTALTNATIGAGVNQAAANLANQTPADFEADINKTLDTSAGIPVSAFESDINQVLDLPATQTTDIFVDTVASELPSGMDLASDVGSTANTVEDVSQALAGEGTDISGQDLAADATTGNTLEDVSTTLTPTPTSNEEETQGLTKEQIASLLKTGLGLFGGITAASKALGSSVPSINSILNTQSVVNSPTPFTGTYSGMNMTNPEYFQQVQQNYNRLFPNTPADVATPLQAWYSTEYKPETPVIKSLFGL